jgi:hypothetical protein
VSGRRILLTAACAAVVAWGCGGGDLTLPVGEGPAQILVVHGNGQQGRAGRLLPDSLVVRLVDTTGDGVAGRPVSWSVTSGGGTAAPESGTTDADGYAWTRWTLGPGAGDNALRATLEGAGFVTFTATAAGTGPSADRSTISADPGSIPVSTGTSTITVRVRDGQGDPVEGATVALAASGTGNTLTQPTGPTDADGVATGTLSSTVAGSKVVTATVNGSIPLSETAQVTVSASPPQGSGVDHFVFTIQPHDVRRDDRFTVEVAMVDVAGNVVPLSGIVIYLGLFDQAIDITVNKRLEGNRFVATRDGVATFDGLAVTKKGTYRFRALSDQLPELGPHGPEPFLFSVPFDVD